MKHIWCFRYIWILPLRIFLESTDNIVVCFSEDEIGFHELYSLQARFSTWSRAHFQHKYAKDERPLSSFFANDQNSLVFHAVHGLSLHFICYDFRVRFRIDSFDLPFMRMILSSISGAFWRLHSFADDSAMMILSILRLWRFSFVTCSCDPTNVLSDSSRGIVWKTILKVLSLEFFSYQNVFLDFSSCQIRRKRCEKRVFFRESAKSSVEYFYFVSWAPVGEVLRELFYLILCACAWFWIFVENYDIFDTVYLWKK